MRGSWASLGVWLAACYTPTPSPGAPCNALGGCPTGLACVADVCQLPGTKLGVDGPVLVVDVRLDGAPDAPDGPPSYVPWSTPTLIPGVNSSSDEDDPSITDDGLTIAFISSRGATPDIYIGTRATTADAFTVSAPAALNSAFDEASPEISPDGSSLYFGSDLSGAWQIYRSTFAAGLWSTPSVVGSLSGGSLDGDLAVSPDRLTALVVRSGGTIWKATRNTTQSPFGSPVEQPALEISPNNAAPTLTNGAQIVLLHADNPRDLYQVAPGPAFAISELDTSARESGPFINQAVTHLLFARSGDLYEATRP